MHNHFNLLLFPLLLLHLYFSVSVAIRMRNLAQTQGCGGGLCASPDCEQSRSKLYNRRDFDYDSLCNFFTLLGPKVVLVNLDDREECERLEREGVFIQTSDLVFITGFINAGAG